MKNILKQFEEWVTHLNQSEYRRAVVLLTIKYTFGVFIILIVFNFLVYGLFSNSLETNESESIEHSQEFTENDEHSSQFREGQTEELEGNLVQTLFISDGLILILAFFTAFLLSKRTLTPLEESYKKQARFIADAAHEFRTPLAVMRAGSEVILRSHRTAPEYEKFINESLDEVKRLTTLSNNLLFLAQNNRKKTDLISRVSLTEICEKQVEVMTSYAKDKEVSIKFASEGNCIVLGNKDDLIRLVINLIKNAIDYNRKSGIVTVSLKTTKNEISLTVGDNGVGIKAEDLPHIFERFYKADASRSQAHSGTGLGLAIVKEIVSEHKGDVKVTSSLEKGTIFKVVFPA